MITPGQFNGVHYMQPTDEYIIGDTRTGATDFYLPPVAAASNKTYWITFNAGANSCKVHFVETSGTLFRDHTTTTYTEITLNTPYRWIAFMSDGTDWHVNQTISDADLDYMDQYTMKGRVAGGFGPPSNLDASLIKNLLAYEATEISYDNTTSLISPTDVQSAIDYIVSNGGSIGTFALSGIITPSALTGTTDNYNPTGFSAASVVRISASGSTRDLTGLEEPARNGDIKIFQNVGAQTVRFKHYNAGSTSNRRFYFPQGVDFDLRVAGVAWFIYMKASHLWFMITPHIAGATIPGVVNLNGSAGWVLQGDNTMLDMGVFAPYSYVDAKVYAVSSYQFVLPSSPVSITAWPSTDTFLCPLGHIIGELDLGASSQFRLVVNYDGLGSGLPGAKLVVRGRVTAAPSAYDTSEGNYAPIGNSVDIGVDLDLRFGTITTSGWMDRDPAMVAGDQWILALIMISGDDVTPLDISSVRFETR